MLKPVRPAIKFGEALYCYEPYHAADGWRWRKWSRNGKITADSGEAYGSKRGAMGAARKDQASGTSSFICVGGKVVSWSVK